MMLGVFSRLDFSFQGLKDTPTIADWLHKTITEEGGQIGVDSSVMSSGLIIYVITFYNLISPYFISFIKQPDSNDVPMIYDYDLYKQSYLPSKYEEKTPNSDKLHNDGFTKM